MKVKGPEVLFWKCSVSVYITAINKDQKNRIIALTVLIIVNPMLSSLARTKKGRKSRVTSFDEMWSSVDRLIPISWRSGGWIIFKAKKLKSRVPPLLVLFYTIVHLY